MTSSVFLQYLLLPSTAGFLLLHCSLPRRFRAHRLSAGHYPIYLLTLSVELYLLCLLGSIALSKWCYGSFAWPVDRLGPTVDELVSAFPDSFRPIPLLTVPIALVVAAIENLVTLRLPDSRIVRESLKIPSFFKAPLPNIRASAVAHFMRDCNDARLTTVYRAQVLGKPVMITLGSRKVYVGVPSLSLDPTVDHSYLKLLLIASGVRDDQDATVKLTTFYDEVSGALQNAAGHSGPLACSPATLTMSGLDAEIDTHDIGTLVAWDEIHSLLIWDPELYRLFDASIQKVPQETTPLTADTPCNPHEHKLTNAPARVDEPLPQSG